MVSLSRQLAQWVGGLRYEDLPPEVVDRAKGVTLHSLASVLLGSQSRDGQQAAARAVPVGRWLYTDTAHSDRTRPGYGHVCVHHTQHESAWGDVPETRAEGLVALCKAYVRVLRSHSNSNLPNSVGFLQRIFT